MQSTVRVQVIANERYAMRLAVAGRSMLENLAPDCQLHLMIVEHELSETTRERLMNSWKLPRLTVEWLPLEQPIGRAIREIPGLPSLYFERLTMLGSLPDHWDRLIILDADVVVAADLSRLWNEPMQTHHLILATRDPWIPTVCHSDGITNWSQFGLAAGTPYLNAAVMLLDLQKLRRYNFVEKAVEFCNQYGNGILFGEQDVMNVLLADKWGQLDPRWQVHPRILGRPRLAPPFLSPDVLTQMARDPWIYHFGGRLKPWDYRGRHAADEIFYQILDRTDWRGWRPRHTVRSWMYGIYDSPLRDWLHPIEVSTRRALRSIRKQWIMKKPKGPSPDRP